MQTREALTRLHQLGDIVPSEDVFAVFRLLIEVCKGKQTTELEKTKVEAAKEVALTRITKKHDLYRDVFCRIFEERRNIIAHCFALIDKGLASGDRDLMLRGLQGVGEIVAASPFANLKELAQVLEGDTRLEF